MFPSRLPYIFLMSFLCANNSLHFTPVSIKKPNFRDRLWLYRMYGFTLDLVTVNKPLGIDMYTEVGSVLSSCTLNLHAVYPLKTE